MAENVFGKDLLNAPLARPLNRENLGQDRLALRNLVSMLNNPAITGAEVPRGEDVSLPPPIAGAPLGGIKDPVFTSPVPQHIAAPIAASVKRIDASKNFYTGRLKAGKDFCAIQSGAKIFGFSEPLYYLLKFFFGVDNKDLFGARKFCQKVGQWGRGVINEQYDLTTERAVFTTLIRAAAGSFSNSYQVDWSSFGVNENIWLDGAVKRIEAYQTENIGARVAIVNVRFENEFKSLRQLGFRHYHVMCSTETWSKRLAKDGLNSNSPIVTDYSEKLAIALDHDVTKQISRQRVGPKLNVIWNDENVPPPSPRLYTTTEFLSALAPAAVASPSII
jgi:hypothetical protein